MHQRVPYPPSVVVLDQNGVVGDAPHNAGAPSLSTPSPRLMVCTIAKSACSTLRKHLLHVAGRWHSDTCPADVVRLAGLAKGSKARLEADLRGPPRFCAGADMCECDENRVHSAFWGISTKDRPVAWQQAAYDPDVVRAIFVRNPFTRFLSGLRDKKIRGFARLMQLDGHERELVEECKGAGDPYRSTLVSPSQPFLDPEWFESPDEVELACFARAATKILADRQARRRLLHLLPAGLVGSETQPTNEHWRPQAELCGATAIPYDFVGRTEHLAYSEALLFHAIPWTRDRFYDDPQLLDESAHRHSSKPADPEPDGSEAPDGGREKAAVINADRTRWEWRQVRRLGRWLGPQGIDLFLQVYAVDFHLFGYDPNPDHYGLPLPTDRS